MCLLRPPARKCNGPYSYNDGTYTELSTAPNAICLDMPQQHMIKWQQTESFIVTNLRLLVESSHIPTNDLLDTCERVFLQDRPKQIQIFYITFNKYKHKWNDIQRPYSRVGSSTYFGWAEKRDCFSKVCNSHIMLTQKNVPYIILHLHCSNTGV